MNQAPKVRRPDGRQRSFTDWSTPRLRNLVRKLERKRLELLDTAPYLLIRRLVVQPSGASRRRSPPPTNGLLTEHRAILVSIDAVLTNVKKELKARREDSSRGKGVPDASPRPRSGRKAPA